MHQRLAIPFALALAVPSLANAAPIGSAGGSPDRSPEVVGGDEGDAGRFPDVVFVELDGGHCSGTLVAPNAVLTAAHCLEGTPKAVVIGALDPLADDVERIEIVQTLTPSNVIELDAALLRLEHPTTATPRPIVHGCALADLANQAEVTLVGYGVTTTDDSAPPTLHQAVQRIADANCSQGESLWGGDCYLDKSLVARAETVSACFGDSGGPLYLNTAYGDVLVGLVHGGVGPDDAGPCSLNEANIYTRADALVEWIEGATGRTLPVPTCDNVAPKSADTELDVDDNGRGTATIKAEDDGALHYVIVSAPSHGKATISATGVLSYTAGADFAGQDSVVVRIEDDGVPALGTDITVSVLDSASSGGCSAAGSAPMGLWLFLLAAPLFRRRRR